MSREAFSPHTAGSQPAATDYGDIAGIVAPGFDGGVLLVAPHFWPSAAVGAKRFVFLAREFSKAGFPVRALTFRPGAGEATDRSLPCSGAAHPVASVLPPIGRLRRFVPLALQTPDRFVGWWPSSIFGGWRLIRRAPPAVIIATGPPFTAFLTGACLRRLSGAKLILDYRDPWTGFDWTGTKHARTRGSNSLNRKLERWAVSRADALVFATEAMRAHFVERIPVPADTPGHVLTNGFDDARSVAPRALSTDRKNIVYAGTLYGQRRISDLTDALHVLREEAGAEWSPPAIHVFGIVTAEDRERVAEKGMTHLLHEHQRVDHAVILGYLKAADVLYLPTGGSTHYSYDIPYKLFDYLSVRRPVLAFGPRDSEVASFMRAADCGVMAYTDEPGSLPGALAQLLGGDRQHAFTGVERYTWNAIGAEYLRLVARVVSEPENAERRGG